MSGQTQPETALQALAEKLRTDAIAIFGEGQAERDIIEWSRALRLADDTAESAICTEGHSPAAYHWVLTQEQIAADPYLEDCIAHLEWRKIARRFDAEDGVTVIFEEQP